MQSHRPPPDLPRRTEVRISVARQTLEFWRDGVLLCVFPVSTAAAGVGTEPGSLRTPSGRFRICERIGQDAPSGTVFRSRIPTGEPAGAASDEDLILTRILWLDGIDPDNANTRERYIYIHGTNKEESIGQPSSAGCIRMRNADVARLFDLVDDDTDVSIEA